MDSFHPSLTFCMLSALFMFVSISLCSGVLCSATICDALKTVIFILTVFFSLLVSLFSKQIKQIKVANAKRLPKEVAVLVMLSFAGNLLFCN